MKTKQGHEEIRGILKATINRLKIARAKLVAANRGQLPKGKTMAEFNRARAKLQQAVKCANAFLYGNK